MPSPSREQHRRRDGAYPEPLRPPARLLARWARRARQLEDRGYTKRWAEFWKRTVLALRTQGTWKDHDITLVAEYVRRCQLVELHVEEAEKTPYLVNPDSGFMRPHPGWERSLGEAREARAIAVELKLTPRTREAAGIDVPPSGGPPRIGDVPGWADDQHGPDGQPL